MQLVKKVKYKKWNCNLFRSVYFNERVALILSDADDGSSVATCTVNLTDEILAENEVFIKDYSENKGMLNFLIAEGIIKPTGRKVQCEYVSIPVCKLLI